MKKIVMFTMGTATIGSHPCWKDLIEKAEIPSTEAEVLGMPTVNVTLQTEMIGEKLKKQTLAKKLSVI